MKNKIGKKTCIAVAILFLIVLSYLIIAASHKNNILISNHTFINISTFINSFTFPNIICLTSALFRQLFLSARRFFVVSFLIGFAIYFYRESNKSEGFVRMRKWFVFALKAGYSGVLLSFPWTVARVITEILGNGLAP